MTTFFASLWRHIHGCDFCNKLGNALCADGDALLDAAVKASKRAAA